MKRGLMFILCLSLILVLSLSFISAGWFSDFWGKITGKVIVECTDSDNGINPFVRGIGTGLYGQEHQKILVGEENPNKCSITWDYSLEYTTWHDCCWDSETTNQLQEAFCRPDGLLGAYPYNCPNGCKEGVCIEMGEGCVDFDGDNYFAYDEFLCPSGNDCDDTNPDVNPSEPEWENNGIDDDCNGLIDCIDMDQDGYLVYIETSCPEGNDCVDSDPYIHPGATEICNGIDDNCNEIIDEGCGGITCTDSDDGKNFFVKGQVKHFDNYGDIDLVLDDYCLLRQQTSGVKVSSCSGESCAVAEAICIDNDAIIYSPEGMGTICKYGCNYGACLATSIGCIPDCEGKQCGSNGCGGNCGTCLISETCINDVCVSEDCVSDDFAITCEGSVCGIKINNCGEEISCGMCGEGFICFEGSCIKEEESVCSDGTLINKCSSTKPKYCNSSRNLIDDCQTCGCATNYECQEDGNCVIPTISIAPNTKLTSLYSNKEVFLVSDKDWKNVLPFVPVAVWTDNEDNIYKYPFLIFHKEDTGVDWGFDADSIIYFMQQYDTKRVTIIGETPPELDNLLIANPKLGVGLEKRQIQRISVDAYLSYWESFDTIIYVEDNYELALLASTYASLINAPLIIQGITHDSAETFSGRNIICVGSVTPTGNSCIETYNLEGLQQKYVDETNTDKIILVNPDDLDIKLYDRFKPEKSTERINDIYTKISLAAPILASSKHEIILSTTLTNYQNIDSFIKNKIDNLQINPEYLTIVASPNVIQMSRETDTNYYDRKWREEVDNHIYGNLDEDSFQELAVGRIFSYTISDISSYIARVLFYSEIPRDNEFTILWPPPYPYNGFTGMKLTSLAIEQILKNMDFNSISFITDQDIPPSPLDFENKFILTYADHAWINGGMYNFNYKQLREYNVWLNNPLVFMKGCGTCAFELAPLYVATSKIFCAELLRRGAVSFYGATVDASFANWDTTKMLMEELLVSDNIGQAVKNIRNKATISQKLSQKIHPTVTFVPYDQFNVLIGDPTFNPNLINHGLEKITVSTSQSDKNYMIDVTIPKVYKNVEVDWTSGETILKIRFFSYPFGNKIGRMLLYQANEGVANTGTLLFSLNIPKGYLLKQIKKVEYVGDQNILNINSWSDVDYKNIFYEKDHLSEENTYYFAIFVIYDKEALYSQEIIPQQQFKIYFELEQA